MDAMTPAIQLINANRAASDARASYHLSQLDSVRADVVANAQHTMQHTQHAFNSVWNDASDAIQATNEHFGARLNILEAKVEQILTLVQPSMGHSTSTKNTRDHGSGCADAQ